MFEKHFSQIWEQLRAKKSQYEEFLEEISIKNFRGIQDLSVRFDFPVTVIAGPNASGKSTVLFACACAYKVPGSTVRDFVPTTLFPSLKIKTNPSLSDLENATAFEFFYINQGKRAGMRWSKGKSWNRSFMGQKGGKQPERQLYLRTLANLTSPSEVRSILQIGKKQPEEEKITSDLIALAQRILPLRYKQISKIIKGDRDLLFAVREDAQTQYSEFHMSAGERAILRISKDISHLRNALILIDEIEAGMHPFTQQQIMLELQRLALRNDLQIVVTTHSAVVLDSVPVEARIFLERQGENVIVKPAYKDIIQKAFYGQSLEKLSILCEDEIGEAFLHGAMDYINPKIGILHEDVIIGRDTGKSQFGEHIKAVGKFKMLSSFLFVLDGDARPEENKLKLAAEEFGAAIQPLFLPGADVPERWAWEILSSYSDEYADLLGGISKEELRRILTNQDSLFASAADKPADVMKNKFFAFAEQIRRSVAELMRLIARNEAQRETGDIKIFTDELELQIRNWQSRK